MNSHAATTRRSHIRDAAIAPLPLQKNTQEHWLWSFIHRHFTFPTGEFAIVAENGSKISLPTPLLGALIALFVWLAGGTLAGVWLVATMSANVSNLSDSITQYQIRSEAEKKAERDRFEAEIRALREKNELTELKLSDLREKQIRAEGRRN